MQTWTYDKDAAVPQWLEGRYMKMPAGEMKVLTTNPGGGDPVAITVRPGAVLQIDDNGLISKQ